VLRCSCGGNRGYCRRTQSLQGKGWPYIRSIMIRNTPPRLIIPNICLQFLSLECTQLGLNWETILKRMNGLSPQPPSFATSGLQRCVTVKYYRRLPIMQCLLFPQIHAIRKRQPACTASDLEVPRKKYCQPHLKPPFVYPMYAILCGAPLPPFAKLAPCTTTLGTRTYWSAEPQLRKGSLKHTRSKVATWVHVFDVANNGRENLSIE
jgi:hypothetical protein